MQAGLAAHWNCDYAAALVIVAVVAIVVAVLSGLGYEKKHVLFGTEEAEAPSGAMHRA